MTETRRKGNFCGGQLPFGYRVENKKVVIHEVEAEIVRNMFSDYSNGKIAKEILEELNQKGIHHKGKPFTINTFYGMLRMEKYIGIYKHNETGEVYDNIYPPIIPKSLFEEIQFLLDKNKLGSKSRYTDYLLRNKLFCGYCGKTLQGESGTSRNKERKHYYKCLGRKKYHCCDKTIVPKDALEQLIIDSTLQVLGTPENISLIADKVLEANKQRLVDKSLITILMNNKLSIEKSLSNIMKAIEEGILTQSTKTRLHELEQKLSDIDDKILIEQFREQNQLTREQVINYLEHSIKQNPKLMIYTLIQKIILYDDKVEILYNYTDNTNPRPPLTDDGDFPSICGSTFLPLGAP